jgi:hypothetical protein
MVQPQLSRPESSEYISYYERYIKLVPENDIVQATGIQIEETMNFLRSLSNTAGDKRYAPDKWNIKEVVGHMIDCERVFIQRALFFARNNSGPLPGFEQDDFIAAANFNSQPFQDLINEYEFVRRSDLYFFRHLSREAWLREGIANDNKFTVRALAYICLGHERHHIDIIKTRYMQNEGI